MSVDQCRLVFQPSFTRPLDIFSLSVEPLGCRGVNSYDASTRKLHLAWVKTHATLSDPRIGDRPECPSEMRATAADSCYPVLMHTIDLSGKVALVTGGSQGLGLCTATQLHAAGASVAVNYFPDAEGMNRQRAEAAVAALGERAMAVAGDVRDAADVARMFDERWSHRA